MGLPMNWDVVTSNDEMTCGDKNPFYTDFDRVTVFAIVINTSSGAP
jgi:hypothetical protein